MKPTAFWCAAVALALVSAPAAADWASTEQTIDGHRTWIYTPRAAAPDGKRGLVVVLHGCDQTHTQLKEHGNLTEAAERHGLVVAVPYVTQRPFGPGCWNYDRAADAAGHVAGLVALTKTLAARPSLAIDSRRVHVLGLSSGGAMSLVLACAAPDLFAGVGAVAGPSVGSWQMQATAIPADTTAGRAAATCLRLARRTGTEGYLATQVANVAHGEMDKDGGKHPANRPGQHAYVSKRWSEHNAAALAQVYGTSGLGAPVSVQNDLARERVAVADGRPRLSFTMIADVGHAWPAGMETGPGGGNWIATAGLEYPGYVTDWLVRNAVRGDAPLVVAAKAKTCREHVASNVEHVQGGRAVQRAGFVYAKGSGRDMGLHNDTYISMVAETRPGHFKPGTCPR